MIFNKLPRLETESATGFPDSLCKSSPVPNPGSENHFNYKGSYFSCPLQSPDGPEQPLARWSPAAAYLHYGTDAGSQPVLAEGPPVSCLLYRPESLGSGLQPLGAEKAKDSLMRELLMARDKWTSLPLALGHPFPVKKPVAVNKAAPLAVPKPVYRAPACFVGPRMALPLGPRAESLQQRPGNADWALPAATPANHPLHPSEPCGGTGLHKRGPHSNPSLPPPHPGLAPPAKEKVGSPVAFSPYYAAFEKYRGPPSTPFLEAGCPAAHSQRKVPEVPSLSPDPWLKLQPPAASLAYRERPPACYPHAHYPLPLHKAALLYHPPAPTLEVQPSALPGTYKGFSFVGSGEPFPSAYLKPQAPRSYFPGPVDTYVPRADGSGTVASPPAKSAALPRDAEQPQRAGYLPSPGFAFSPGDAAVPGSSLAGREPGCRQHRADSPQRRAVGRHNSAFQPLCVPEKVPGGSGGLAETFPKGEGGWVKASQGEQNPPYPGRRRASPAPQDTPRGEPPAPIIAGKGGACKVKDAAKELIPPSPAASPPEGPKVPRDAEVSPSSPPMPVINNVFSLAPYRDYLEGTEGSAQVPFSREHLQGDTPPQITGSSCEPAALGDVAVMPSLLPAGTGPGQALKTARGAVQSQGESCYGRVPEKPKLVPQDLGSQGGSPGRVGSGEPAPESIALDLSLKKRLAKAGETQGPIGHTEGMPEGEDAEEEKEGLGGKARVGEGAKPRALPLLLEVGSGDKSNFQSSATFMFKKYKILRSLPPSAIPPRQAGSPHTQPSPPPPAPSGSIPTPPSRTPPPPHWPAAPRPHSPAPLLCGGLARTRSSPRCPKPPARQERRASRCPGTARRLPRRPPPASISPPCTPRSVTLLRARCPGPPQSSCGSG